jgi:type II secretory pathway pseudopilin PulG
MSIRTRIHRAASREDGFTMIVAIMVLAVSSLLVAAVFVGAQGDVALTRANTSQKEAYYAAMAGISAYKYQLSANTSYWKACPSISTGTVPTPTGGSSTQETYKVKTLPTTGSTESECLSGKQSAILEASGSAVGTFRIESTGIYGKGTSQEAKRSLVATFTHPGYLNYVYLSNFEEADPETRGGSTATCEVYHEERVAKGLESSNTCISFPWIPLDKVEGPFHTNDEADIDGSPTFGRSGHNDAIEMNKGYYNGKPNFEGDGYTTKGLTLLPPEVAATELLSEAGDQFAGKTIITLEGTRMTVTALGEGKAPEIKSFPTNGVISILNSSAGCPVKYEALETMYGAADLKCGNVYIKGKYTQSLTVIAQNDIIAVGNLTTEGGESGGAPTGNAALGLIAIGHARLYHPIKECEKEVEHEEEISGEAEVKEKSKTLKGVSPTLNISVGDPISGPKIKSGSTVKSILNLARGEIEISKEIEGTGTSSKKETVTFEITVKVKEIVKCKNTESQGGLVTCNSAGNATATDNPAKEFGTSINNPIIDAAILSTKHSWGVDNYSCPDNPSGSPAFGDLTIWGSIAENFRGRVTCCEAGGIYIKNYKYDERLKTIQPPDFLAPSSTEVTLSRVTAPPNGFGEG